MKYNSNLENNILIEEKNILEYIKFTLKESRYKTVVINNAKFHHNTSYNDAPLICHYGILSMVELKKNGLKNYSKQCLKVMSDIESHVNGEDAVSLSVVGLKDLYPGEEEYNPHSLTDVDFLVSSDIRTRRNNQNYGNEFLVSGGIGIDKLRSIDVRLLDLMEDMEDKRSFASNSYTIHSLIDKYNNLKNIALAVKKTKLDIPIREMSSVDNFSMDIDKLSKVPKLILKHN